MRATGVKLAKWADLSRARMAFSMKKKQTRVGIKKQDGEQNRLWQNGQEKVGL